MHLGDLLRKNIPNFWERARLSRALSQKLGFY